MNLKTIITTAGISLLSVGFLGAPSAFAVRPPPPYPLWTYWHDCRADQATCDAASASGNYDANDWCSDVKWSNGQTTYNGWCYD